MKNGKTLRRLYDVSILVLSIYVIGQLMLELVLDLSEREARVLSWIDTAIAILFLADWFVFFFRAEKKAQYGQEAVPRSPGIDTVCTDPETSARFPCCSGCPSP